MRGVEPSGLGGVEVDERKQRVDGLIDRGPARCSFVAVVVRWINAFGDAFETGDGFDGASECGTDSGAYDAGEGAVIAFYAHDTGSGDTKISCSEVAHTNEIGRDESVFEGDQRVEGGLSAGEHVLRKKEVGKRRGLASDGLLEEIV